MPISSYFFILLSNRYVKLLRIIKHQKHKILAVQDNIISCLCLLFLFLFACCLSKLANQLTSSRRRPMSHTNVIQSISAVAGLQELSDENTASIQGGFTVYGAYLYDRYRSKTPLLKAHSGSPKLTASNDRVSKIVITSGTWDFWEHPNQRGKRKTLRKGVHLLTGFWDNRISSFKRRDN